MEERARTTKDVFHSTGELLTGALGTIVNTQTVRHSSPVVSSAHPGIYWLAAVDFLLFDIVRIVVASTFPLRSLQLCCSLEKFKIDQCCFWILEELSRLPSIFIIFFFSTIENALNSPVEREAINYGVSHLTQHTEHTGELIQVPFHFTRSHLSRRCVWPKCKAVVKEEGERKGWNGMVKKNIRWMELLKTVFSSSCVNTQQQWMSRWNEMLKKFP